MGLFNFNLRNNTDNSSNDADKKVVELMLNSEGVIVNAADVEGMTIAEAFEQYSDQLGDADRINKYVCQGTVLRADTRIEPGKSYRGSINSESKG